MSDEETKGPRDAHDGPDQCPVEVRKSDRLEEAVAERDERRDGKSEGERFKLDEALHLVDLAQKADGGKRYEARWNHGQQDHEVFPGSGDESKIDRRDAADQEDGVNRDGDGEFAEVAMDSGFVRVHVKHPCHSQGNLTSGLMSRILYRWSGSGS